MFLSYLALFGASLFEILWVALLGAHTSAKSHFYVLMLCACMGLSLYLLGVASKTIPITVSYAIWVGLGILGQAIIQHFVFKNTLSITAWVFTCTLTISVFGLLFSQTKHGVI
ncbi:MULTISPECIES: DMT family transporter [Pseudoalteromonas]|uniref:DMT family transporter n=1 Tax=Pseudoalteromonas TaxID=53246 RepID=UPI00026CA37C|nr:SMR family transporter [Pseudoalteromonas spongiae]ATD01490.1 hypothetical protein PSPO_b1675 [Pseudoalteromonas spongiae UST010723-006]